MQSVITCRSPHGERGLKCEYAPDLCLADMVALLTESVDWNPIMRNPEEFTLMSLSSRRAWIEIAANARQEDMIALVALLTESVDWNWPLFDGAFNTVSRSPHGERGLKFALASFSITSYPWSLSSRRAWIEIRKWVTSEILPSSRSPHGERGLKFRYFRSIYQKIRTVALLTESVDWNFLIK